MQPTDWYISDLHLSPDQPGITDLYRQFLKQQLTNARSLTVIGDLLEGYAGRRQLALPFTADVMGWLTEVANSGTETHFVAGNRDFLLARDCARLGINGHRDDFLQERPAGTVASIHGDTFCLDDKAYLRFRLLMRTLPLHYMAAMVPGCLSQRVLRWLRRKSLARRERTKHLPRRYFDIKDEAVVPYLNRTGATTVIAGHIHHPQERHYPPANSGGPVRRLLVLSDWSPDGAVIARAIGDQPPELVRLTPEGIVPWPHEISHRGDQPERKPA